MVLLHDGSDTLLERRGRRGLGHGAILTAFRTFDGSTGDRRCGTTAPACSKVYLQELSAVSLSASRVPPNCGGAALMASDIYYDAARRFPRPLRGRYVAYALGTNTAGDPRARYRCTISNRFYTAEAILCAAPPLFARTSKATAFATCSTGPDHVRRRPRVLVDPLP